MPEAAGEVRLRRPERRQMAWVPQCPDDWVPAGHGVRTVADVVAKLDLTAFQEAIRAREGVAGRDATDPELLVALWLYACIRGIGSARELARRCEESAPFRWLCGGVSVNHRMLSDFRTDHGAALDQLFTQVIASLVDQELVRVSRISQDGLRVRVSAGGASFRREERLRKLLAESQNTWRSCGGKWTRRRSCRPQRHRRSARRQAAQDRQSVWNRHWRSCRSCSSGRRKEPSEPVTGIRAEDTGKGVAGEHDGSGSARDENGQWRISSGVERATGGRPESRAILGVEVSNEGSDSAGLSEPMREQVEQRTGEGPATAAGWRLLAEAGLERRTRRGWSCLSRRRGRGRRGGRELEPKRTDSAAMGLEATHGERTGQEFTDSGRQRAKRSTPTCAPIGA